MFKRFFLGFLFLASIAWVVFYAYDIASEKNNFVPEIVFSEEDGQLLVVIRPNELSLDALSSFDDSPCREIMVALNDSSYVLGYFSQKRPHLLLITEQNWSPEKIKRLFKGLDPKMKSDSKFSVAGFEGNYYKSNLYLQKGEIAHEGDGDQRFYYDKKASASLFAFDKGAVKNQTDIYFKGNGTVNYITRDAQIKQGSQVRDEVIFGGMVSRNISSYHFFERDYYATLDPVFAKSPMQQWMLSGFTSVEYDGERALISDYIGGQDPILVLNDINHTLDSTRFKNQLTQDFPSKGKSYTVKYLEDLVVIAEKTSTCDKIIADYKLGNTIASSVNDRYKYYGELPKAVSERSVGGSNNYSKSVYKGKIMETHTGVAAPETPKELSASVNLSCGFDIADFVVFEGKGNVCAVGRNGEIALFKNKQLVWKKQLEGKLVGKLQAIDLHDNGELFVLASTTSKIYLWSASGTAATGFPISLETTATNRATFYRWQEKSYFLIADESNKVSQFDAKGRELDVFKSKHEITAPIDIWVSQKRLFAGFASATQFTMFELGKRRELRTFDISAGSVSMKVSNQLFHFAIENGHLVRTDQKATKDKLDAYPNGKIINVVQDRNSQTMALQVGNTIKLLNTQGIAFGNIPIPFNQVEDISLYTNNSGKTFVCLIDGLENNVYLYSTDGKKLNTKALEGQTKVHFQTIGATNCISTVVDQFVIQYIER